MQPRPAADRWKILTYAWLSFGACFFAWFSLAPLMVPMQGELGLTNMQVAWLVTAGVVLTIPGRILIGGLVDRYGPRRIYALLMLAMALPVFLLGFATSFSEMLVLRLLIGLSGCSFVIGIRLVLDWFPRSQVGMAEGIYGGWGNAGSAVAAISLPLLAIYFGWRTALSLGALPLLVMAFLVWRRVSDVPAGKVYRRTPIESNYSPWKDRRVLLLALAYLAVFGSELCVVGFLPKYYHDKFDLPLASAGAFASIFGFMNLVARPAGGILADRFGRRITMLVLLGSVGVLYALLGLAPTLWTAVVATAVASIAVQASQGAVFATVPLVSPTDTGRISGIVGAAGNVGGLIFPIVMGVGLASTGSYLPGFLFIGAVSLFAFVVILFLPIGNLADEHDEGGENAMPGIAVRRVTMYSAAAAGEGAGVSRDKKAESTAKPDTITIPNETLEGAPS